MEEQSEMIIDRPTTTTNFIQECVKESSAYVAEGSIERAHAILKKWGRSTDNSNQGLIASLGNKIDLAEDEWRFQNDVLCRIAKLNEDESLPPRTQEVITAMAIEVWHAFFHSDDVSFATVGIRNDLKRNTIRFGGESDDSFMCIGHFLSDKLKLLSISTEQDTYSHHVFAMWVDTFCNHDTRMEINYYAKFHHCRWYTDPYHSKLNCLNINLEKGYENATRSMLHRVARTCPSGVSNFACAQHVSSAFNLDRNENDMLIINEDVNARQLGIGKQQQPPLDKNLDGSSDASNVFKSRITRGDLAIMSFFCDEENDNRRDMKIVRKSVQGSYLIAVDRKVDKADPHVLSRFIVLEQPKSWNNGPLPEVSDTELAHHREVHRGYYIVECMEKAKVVHVDVEGARAMINQTLNLMQEKSGKQTQSAGKRNKVLELARSIHIAHTVWRVMASPEFKHLQLHPRTGKYIGLNPRVFVDGIFPLLVVSKAAAIHALTLTRFLWDQSF